MSIVHGLYLVFQGMFPSVEGETCASWQKCSLQICSVFFSVWVGIHGPRREAPIARICHHVPTWFIWAVDVAIKSAHLLRTKSLSHVRCPYRFKWHLQRCAHGITRHWQTREFAEFAEFAQLTLRSESHSSRSRVSRRKSKNADCSDPFAEECRGRGYLGAHPCGLPAACAGHVVSWPFTPWLRHSAGGPGQNGRWSSLGEGGPTSRPRKVAQRGILQTYPWQSSVFSYQQLAVQLLLILVVHLLSIYCSPIVHLECFWPLILQVTGR